MRNLAVVLSLVILLAAGIAGASTGTVEARYAGSNAYQVGSISYPGASWGSVVVGVYQLDIAATGATGEGAALAGTRVSAFCMDIRQSVPSGSTYRPYTIDYVDTAPIGAGNTAISAAKADDLRRLFGMLINGPSTGVDHIDLSSANQAAAFQAAVWEIVFESASNAYDVHLGDLVIGGGTTWTGLADTYLAHLHNYAPEMGLRALKSECYQDFALYVPGTGDRPPVPEPVTMLSSLLSIGALGAYIRKAHGKPQAK